MGLVYGLSLGVAAAAQLLCGEDKEFRDDLKIGLGGCDSSDMNEGLGFRV